MGRLDNSAVSAEGAKMAFKTNEEIEIEVRSVPLDEDVINIPYDTSRTGNNPSIFPVQDFQECFIL